MPIPRQSTSDLRDDSGAGIYQETSPGPVEIHLEPNQVYRVSPENPDDGAIFLLRRYEKDGTVYRPNNLVINGHGATILIDDPTRGLLQIENGLNIIVKDLEVDYSDLPFTQGTVIHVNHDSRHIFLKIDASFPGRIFPTRPVPQFDGSRPGWIISPVGISRQSG